MLIHKFESLVLYFVTSVSIFDFAWATIYRVYNLVLPIPLLIILKTEFCFFNEALNFLVINHHGFHDFLTAIEIIINCLN